MVGAGAVSLVPFGRHDRGLERGRIVAHEGDELIVLEKQRLLRRFMVNPKRILE